MSNIYVSGSHGYIGSRLCERFKNDIVHKCDLKMGLDVINCVYDGDVDVVYHLAGQSGAGPSMDDPLNDARQNILGTIKAINIANTNNAKLIFPSSGAAVDPESAYGLSKKTCEEYIKLFCDNYVILRLSSIYGNKPKGVVDNFIRDEKCVIYGDGTAERDFVHVNDIVEALIKAKDWERGVYDCGSGEGTKIIDIANATGKEVFFKDSIVGEKHRVVLDNTTPEIGDGKRDWYPKINVVGYVKNKCKYK